MRTRRRGLSKTEFLMMGSHLNMPKFHPWTATATTICSHLVVSQNFTYSSAKQVQKREKTEP